jgi:undecaprenyl diphosphate synthase
LTEGSREATGADRKEQERLRAAGEIPRHIAVIMDGNGRWAKQRGLPRIAGHQEGVESVRDIVESSGQLGVQFLTLYAFSTENWKRPKDEVSLLMRLLLTALRDETDRLHLNHVRLRTIGDIEALPAELQRELREGSARTAGNTGLTLTLALSYSGRWELTRAIRAIAHDVQAGKVKPEEITEDSVRSYLTTNDLPDPDLLIRTSGELRLSNFLLWQVAYSELYITPGFWPAFRRNDLYAAIDEYQSRERRFGMVSEQVQPNSKKQPTLKRILKSVAGP